MRFLLTFAACEVVAVVVAVVVVVVDDDGDVFVAAAAVAALAIVQDWDGARRPEAGHNDYLVHHHNIPEDCDVSQARSSSNHTLFLRVENDTVIFVEHHCYTSSFVLLSFLV